VTVHRSALVTGSTRGIGFGIAARLAEQGYGLTVAGRDHTRVEEVVAVLRGRGAPDVVGRSGDVLDDEYLAGLVDAHVDRFAGMNALVVNAGAGSSGPVIDFHPKRFDKQIAVNLRSAFILIQHALPRLRLTAGGSAHGAKIVAMASITGMHAEAELAAYGAAKAGLISLCRSINLEENANGVAATAVAPGYVDTDMAEFKHGVLAREDMITVDDVVEVVDMCLRLSKRAIVPEVAIARAGTGALEA
jgi:NAD(P)-dependent dehydrogenase (short-subunit alcohol dehydrogenase family)